MPKKLCCVAALVVAFAAVVTGRPAEAEPGCGSPIPSSFTLSHDIGPCSTAGGFEITASNVVLNLNGFKIIGSSAVGGDGDGVTVDAGLTSVVIKNGTITAFEEGIYIASGAHHVTISGVHVLDNVGNGTTSGDGIDVPAGSSDHIVVTHCDIENNGPFTGVTLYGANNALTASSIVASSGIGAEVGGSSVTVSGNTIRNSSEWGILDSATSSSSVLANHVTANGFSNTTGGIGIVGSAALVKQNVVRYNAGSGIYEGATSGHFIANTALQNAEYGSGFDLEDSQTNCSTNVWRKDRFRTRNETCIH